MYTRPFPLSGVTSTTMFVGSTTGGVMVSATNLVRTELRLQPLITQMRVAPVGSVSGSSMIVGASQVFIAPAGLTGPMFANPDPGATVPIVIWESSM